MKRILSAIILLVAATLASAQINIDPPTRTFTKDGGGGSVLTSGTGTWTASTNVSWLTITPRLTGTAGESCIYVVNSNFSADQRQGVITISGKTHTVTQTGYPATLSPTSATVNLEGASGTISISVAAGVAWTASSNADWVTVFPASGTSTGSVTYTVAPYGGVTTRTTSLTVAGKTFSISQTGADVNIAPKSAEKAYSSDIVQVNVTALATTTWTVTSNSSWISVVDDGNGFGDSTITLAIGTNPSFLPRTGSVNIGSASFSLLQEGTPNPILDLLPKEATADPLGAYGNVAILATPDAPWTAESMSPWITISQGSSGSGNGNIQYVASANPNLSSRTGSIRINPPVYQPRTNLSWMLSAHINNSSADVSGWGRNLSAPLTQLFNGTNPIYMSGQNFCRNDDAFSIACWFQVGSSATVHRLLEVNRGTSSYSTLYVDASNRIVFNCAGELLTHTVPVETNVWYQVLVTADTSRVVNLHVGKRTDAALVNVSKTFSATPFPQSYVTPGGIKLGSAVQPSSGNLANSRIDDLRLYGRALNNDEARNLLLLAGTTKP